MGKTTTWLRGLFGGKKSISDEKPATEKRRWAFLKMSSHADKAVRSSDERKASSREEGSFSGDKAVRSSAGDERKASNREEVSEGAEQNKHAIAVAEATAAVAEAAVAAAQAAAEVVRLTSTGTAVRRSGARREDWAAVKIQAAFRGYLARRALKALKGLVKLQALVRGYFVRKQAVNKLRYMEAVVNVQTRIRGGRTKISENHQLHKVLQQCPGPATPEKYESAIHTSRAKQDHLSTLNRSTSRSKKTDYAKNWLDQWMNEHPWDHHHQMPTKSSRLDDEKNDKILEVDPGKPRLNPKCLNCIPQQFSNSTFNHQSFATFLDSPSKDSTTAQHSHPSPSVAEMQSLSPVRFPMDTEDSVFCTADNSPELYSITSSRRGGVKRGLFTPTKSDCTRSFLSGYSDYPSYMANTESSRAKVRSQSAPRQRPEFDKSTSTKRLSVHGFGEGKSNRSSSSLHVKFTSKAYPGSGRLDRLGMPIC